MTDAQGPFILGRELLNTPLAEAYRGLRATLLSKNGELPARTVLVTSARAGEGKTTTVANLGIMIGQGGSHALLVDADSRNPTLHNLLAMGADAQPSGGSTAVARQPSAGRGLADVIRNGVEPEQAIVPTPFQGVSLLPAGTDAEKRHDLFGSRRMAEVIPALRDHADLVLIDSSPCLDCVDAFELASLADGVLYVVRAGDQDQAAQRRVEAQLRRARARLLGVVFNGA